MQIHEDSRQILFFLLKTKLKQSCGPLQLLGSPRRCFQCLVENSAQVGALAALLLFPDQYPGCLVPSSVHRPSCPRTSLGHLGQSWSGGRCPKPRDFLCPRPASPMRPGLSGHFSTETAPTEVSRGLQVVRTHARWSVLTLII